MNTNDQFSIAKINGIEVTVNRPYRITANGSVDFFCGTKNNDIIEHEEKFDNKIKDNFKTMFPRLYYLARHLFCPGLLITRSPKYMLKRYFSNFKNNKILNIGSASDIIAPEVINLDLFYTPNVHVLANGTDLPFAGSQFDAVIADMTLEHVAEAGQMISEIGRVLKNDGYIYVSVPFMTAFHSAPGDYYRWTIEGLHYAFKNYNIKELDSRDGPASGLAYVLVDFFGYFFAH